MSKPDKLSTFFSNEFPFNQEGLEEFIQSFEEKSFKKGEILLQSGNKENELRFLDQGFIREYYAKEDKEKNINFYVENEFISDFYSFVTDNPTKKYQECLSDVSIRVLSKTQFTHFLAKYMCGKSFIDELFQKIIAQKEEDEQNVFMNTAEENYQKLFINKPLWLQHIPQYHVASYLGITPETLSRIRKRL